MCAKRRCGLLVVPLSVAALLAIGIDLADAHARHHHRRARLAGPHILVSDPQRARDASEAGAFAGAFETGIIGATTADPYERPGY